MKKVAILGGLACVAVACEGNIVRLGSSSEGGSGGGGGNGVPTTLASEIQLTPTNLVSDGTSLFWTSGVGAGAPVSSVPVGGGPITSVVPGPLPGGFVAVDDVNIYFYDDSGGISRAPKSGGGSSTLVNGTNASVAQVSVLGSSVYWLESGSAGPIQPVPTEYAVKRTPLQGGAISTVAEFNAQLSPGVYGIGVTATTVFISEEGIMLISLPLGSGVPDGGMPAKVPGVMSGCQLLLSDTDAIYCDTGSSIDRVASDGTTTVLGNALGGGPGSLAFDDTYVYWVDDATVGTIMRAPKTGGTAAVFARDTDPLAIAVDANAVYWSDQGGAIMRLAK